MYLGNVETDWWWSHFLRVYARCGTMCCVVNVAEIGETEIATCVERIGSDQCETDVCTSSLIMSFLYSCCEEELYLIYNMNYWKN